MIHYVCKIVPSHPNPSGMVVHWSHLMGYVSIAPRCHDVPWCAMKPQAPKHRKRGGRGGTSQSPHEKICFFFFHRKIINGWSSIAMFQYGTVSRDRDNGGACHWIRGVLKSFQRRIKRTYEKHILYNVKNGKMVSNIQEERGCTGWLDCQEICLSQ